MYLPATCPAWQAGEARYIVGHASVASTTRSLQLLHNPRGFALQKEKYRQPSSNICDWYPRYGDSFLASSSTQRRYTRLV